MKTKDFLSLVAQRLDNPYSCPQWKLPESKTCLSPNGHTLYMVIPTLHPFHMGTPEKAMLLKIESETINPKEVDHLLQTLDQNGQAFKRSLTERLTQSDILKSAERRES